MRLHVFTCVYMRLHVWTQAA